jgi:hypothetical protein
MISERAKDGFNYLLQESLKKNLIASSEDVCEMETIEDVSEIKEKEIVVMSISSYLFRIITFFYFTLNDATKNQFAKINKVQATDMDERAFHDAIGEFGNMYSGSLNRDVGKYFPYVGLSTPNILEKNCADHMASLGCGHIQHYRIAVNSSAKFNASLCICDYADIDFIVEKAAEDASAGELEMF